MCKRFWDIWERGGGNTIPGITQTDSSISKVLLKSFIDEKESAFLIGQRQEHIQKPLVPAMRKKKLKLWTILLW